MRPSHELLLKCHRELDSVALKEGPRCFVSGWQVENSSAPAYLNTHGLIATAVENASRYQFLNDDRGLTETITQFHKTFDFANYVDGEIFTGAGSSPLILATMGALHARSVQTIYYFPPVYYAFFFWAKMFGIEMVPVTERWPALDSFDLQLPERESVLLFSDPAWVVGRFLDAGLIGRIRNWQTRTGSLVIVDGTFQYTKWDISQRSEFTAELAKDKTIRLICPTKAIGVNGIRFAYLLLPAELREDIHYVATNSSGATDGFNVAAALQIMKVLNSEACNRQFIEQIRSRNKALTGVLHDEPIWKPNCTYYVFSKLLVDSERCLTMDQRYFEGPFNSGARINLMIPQAEMAKISIVLPREFGT